MKNPNSVVYFSTSFANMGFLLKDKSIVKVFYSNTSSKVKLHNIYRGKIVDKVSTMACFFVDIGNSNLAILKFHKNNMNYKVGENVIVQIIREPIGDAFGNYKHSIVSDDIYLKTPLFVYKPLSKNIIFTKNITQNNRDEILSKINLQGGGIVRSLYKFNLLSDLINEINSLSLLWEEKLQSTSYGILQDNGFLYNMICENSRNIPSKIHIKKPMEIGDEIDKIKDLKYLNMEIDYIHGSNNQLQGLILDEVRDKLFSSNIAINDSLNISFFEHESFNYIDVNLKHDRLFSTKEEANYSGNMSVIEPIVKLIILKNLSGQILVDMLKITNKNYQNNIVDNIKKNLSNDVIKSFVYGFSNMGLLEISRQKNSLSLSNNKNFKKHFKLLEFYLKLEDFCSNKVSNIRVIINGDLFDSFKQEATYEYNYMMGKYNISFIIDDKIDGYLFKQIIN